MSLFVEDDKLTLHGSRLLRLIDDHLRRKAGMTDELRHYSAVVYRARLMKPVEWMRDYPDKADALWAYFYPDDADNDEANN